MPVIQREPAPECVGDAWIRKTRMPDVLCDLRRALASRLRLAASVSTPATVRARGPGFEVGSTGPLPRVPGCRPWTPSPGRRLHLDDERMRDHDRRLPLCMTTLPSPSIKPAAEATTTTRHGRNRSPLHGDFQADKADALEEQDSAASRSVQVDLLCAPRPAGQSGLDPDLTRTARAYAGPTSTCSATTLRPAPGRLHLHRQLRPMLAKRPRVGLTTRR